MAQIAPILSFSWTRAGRSMTWALLVSWSSKWFEPFGSESPSCGLYPHVTSRSVHRPSRDVKIRRLVRRIYIRRLRRSRLRAEFHRRIAVQAALSFQGRWLIDVGCGPGLLARRLKGEIPLANIVGLDLDRDMLRIARQENSIDVIQANVTQLPLRNGVVDLALSSASLKDWAQPGSGLREIVRCLRPGGWALIYEFLTEGQGSKPIGFRRRFGVVSDLLRRMARFFAPFSLSEAEELIQTARGARGELATDADLGVVRLTFRKVTD